ncbi:MAG: magnesium transporter [Clostridiales Family XIII bacterium]|jgi:magnesium transporter|nr:magnesium transporter [Clostridiales Family XIII bacterium]
MENERSPEEIIVRIIELLDAKKYIRARDEILSLDAVETAEALEEVLEKPGIECAVILFRMLPKDVSVEVFSYLPVDDQLTIVNAITDKEVKYIIDELDFDDMIDVLEELPANIVDKILEKTTKEERKLINTFLHYPEDSAGSLMTPDYISLQKNMTVGEAMAHIRAVGMDSETIYTCYVKDRGRKLIGIVSLRALVVAESGMFISDMLNGDMVYVNVYDDQEKVSETFKRYGFLAIPVVDNEQRLVGIITVDDILDVIEEEYNEDVERMAGVLDSGDADYLDMGVFRHVGSRLPWLIFLMISAMLTGTIIRSFESLLSNVISLAVYLPMLMGTGGNSGSQSATLVIRGMAVGDLELRDAARVLWKEVRISFIIGVVLSCLNFAKILFLDRESLYVAVTVCVSMVVIVTLAKCIGGLLPMLAKRIGIDPALMAAPMISSLTDLISCMSYFALATLIFRL